MITLAIERSLNDAIVVFRLSCADLTPTMLVALSTDQDGRSSDVRSEGKNRPFALATLAFPPGKG